MGRLLDWIQVRVNGPRVLGCMAQRFGPGFWIRPGYWVGPGYGLRVGFDLLGLRVTGPNKEEGRNRKEVVEKLPIAITGSFLNQIPRFKSQNEAQ